MASAFTHIIVGGALACLRPQPHLRLAVVLAAVSVLPDLDVLAFRFGIPYEHPMGHRGFSHSLLFAGVCGLVTPWLSGCHAAAGAREWWSVVGLGFAASLSHGILDALTNGGLGVGFLIPLSADRYFFPWRPLIVSPLSATAFFSEAGVRVLANEIVWVWLPIASLLSVYFLRRARSRRAA